MNPYLRKHPFLPVTLSFAAGILSAGLFPGSPFLTFSLASSALLIAIASKHFIPGNVRGLSQSLLILLSFFFFGASRNQQQYRENQKDHFSHFLLSDANAVVAEVGEVFKTRYVFDVRQINGHAAAGRLSFFSRTDLRVGDLIYMVANIREIDAPKNPFQFDFKRYNHYKQIWYQANSANPPLVLDHIGSFNLWMYRLRIRCEEILRRTLVSENEYALGCALILGDKKEMGAELRSTYADTGAMHVLAVSGLHVGVVYMILLFFFKSIFPTRLLWRIFRSVLILGALWFFVYLVGAPISAWRAALMFSLFEVGILASRSYYPVNILSLGALILLLFDTNSLYDVGFQLSFLAVLGIVTCQREIQNYWNIDHPWGFRIWQMVSLSLAAQVFTFPLTIFYFHQFPVYFWLSGLFAVFLAFLVLSTGLLTLLLSWIPGIGVLCGYLLYGSTILLNTCMFLIQKIPGIVIEKLWMSQGQLITLLLLALVFAVYLRKKRAIMLHTSMATLGFFLMITIIQQWQRLNRVIFIAYYDRSRQFADIVIGSVAYHLHSSELEQEIPKDVLQCRNALGVDQILEASSQYGLYSKEGFIGIGDYRIFFPDSLFRGYEHFPETDILFVKDESGMKGLDKLPGKTHVVVRRNWYSRGQDRSASLEAKGINYHDIYRQGAFIKKIDVKNETPF